MQRTVSVPASASRRCAAPALRALSDSERRKLICVTLKAGRFYERLTELACARGSAHLGEGNEVDGEAGASKG